MADSRLEHRTIKVKQLIEDSRAGRIVIPEFQRDYVWNKSKAPWLVDSLYRGYPISSLLLWLSSEEVKSRRTLPTPRLSAFVGWLIDGQQRSITLDRVLSGTDGIRVVFNPFEEDGKFMLENAATMKNPDWFAVSQLWNEEDYREIRRSLPDNANGRLMEERFEKVRAILEYEIPAVKMIDYSFGNAVEAFKRVNTLGVRLRAADIESAKVAAKHTGFIKDEVAPFIQSLREEGFTRLNVNHLFRVCAFIAHPDGRNRTPLHELQRKDVLTAWNQTKKATREALNLVRSEFGLVNMEILWTGSLLVPIIVHCALPPKERKGKEICAWMALASLFHRYSGAANTALEQDLRACRNDDPIGALLRNLKQDLKATPQALPADFSGKFNDKSALFAVYVACMHRGIKDFFTGAKVLLQPSVDRHHILPRGQFENKQSGQSKADTLANIAFISGATNKSVNMKGPEVYLKNIPKAVLQSQCIPLDSTLWSIEHADEFWAERRKLLAESFNDFIRTCLPGRRVESGPTRKKSAEGTLPVLARYGVMPVSLAGWHNGKQFRAKVLSSGEIQFNGSIYETPSSAAIAATGASKNGWTFWHVQDNEDWIPLDSVRTK